jgi:nicotinamide-nucleotide amidase
MAAAIVGGVPGASDVFCGSLVTYRESAKKDWLAVTPDTLRQFTAESQQTTDEMAVCVIRRTREADWAAAITGHLGPGAPPAIDGHIFVSLARRGTAKTTDRLVAGREFVLKSVLRAERQLEAAHLFIHWVLVETSGDAGPLVKS